MLILALQICPLDQEYGLELAKLIVDLEEKPRRDVEIAVCYRRDTDEWHVNEIVRTFQSRFTVHKGKSDRRGTGFPYGSNDLWAYTVSFCYDLKRNNRTTADGVLTFEADCVPMRKDWISLLVKEWNNRGSGIDVVGHFHEHLLPSSGKQGHHVNGNAIFGIDLVKRYQQLASCPAFNAWDVHHAPLLTKIGKDTNMIYQKYRMPQITEEEFCEIRKNGEIPALFHGVKGFTPHKVSRKVLIENKEDNRKPVTILDPESAEGQAQIERLKAELGLNLIEEEPVPQFPEAKSEIPAEPQPTQSAETDSEKVKA